MSSIKIKAFILPKEGETSSCEDSFGINTYIGRFAVADGVHNSYHPEFMAQLLCHKFADGSIDINEWDKSFPDVLFKEIYPLWQERVGEYESHLSGRRLSHAMVRRENLPSGASTFAGITVDLSASTVRGKILGDSTLFLITDKSCSALCSSNDEHQEVNEITYDNNPHCVTANGFIYGKWRDISFPLQTGYMILATDGFAEWLHEELKKGLEVAQQIWDIQSHDAFIALVSKARQKLKMEDDITFIMLKIEDIPSCEFTVSFIDDSSHAAHYSSDKNEGEKLSEPDTNNTAEETRME